MPPKDYRLHDGKKGAALGVRVVPRAKQNEIADILKDGTIRVRLKAAPQESEINRILAEFLAMVLEVSADKTEVVAGQSGRDKLVSVIDLDASTAQERILQRMA